jgi:single-strand DNA-binding protein
MNSSANITGNLTRDPELKFLDSGMAVARFTVAVSEKRKDRNGVETEQTSFFDCDAMGTIAQNVADSLRKGDRVVVTGNFKQRSWDDKDGNKRSVIELKVESVGPDLRFATATVSRNSGNSMAAPRPSAPIYDEEPF